MILLSLIHACNHNATHWNIATSTEEAFIILNNNYSLLPDKCGNDCCHQNGKPTFSNIVARTLKSKFEFYSELINWSEISANNWCQLSVLCRSTSSTKIINNVKDTCKVPYNVCVACSGVDAQARCHSAGRPRSGPDWSVSTRAGCHPWTSPWWQLLGNGGRSI